MPWLQDNVFVSALPSANSTVFKRVASVEAARRESAMLMRVQLYPQFYVHLRSTFRGELGDLWLEMDRLPGSGLGMIPDCITLQSVLCSLLQVRVRATIVF